jgi:PAS domain S-box-containing protein
MSSPPAVFVLGANPQDAASTVRDLRSLGYGVTGPVAPLQLVADPANLSRYQLIVIDLQPATLLAELDAAEQLRAAVDLPILLLLPDVDVEMLRFAGKVHTFDCLLKPCSSAALRMSAELALARHASKLRLQSADDSYRDLVENSYDLICTHDVDGRILSVNAAAERALGYPREALVGRYLQNLLAPDAKHLFPAYLAEVLEKGSAHGVMRMSTANAEVREWEYHNSERRLEDGRRIVRGLAHDVTEQLKATRELRASEQRFRALFEQAAVGVAYIDTHTGRLLAVNQKCAQILRYAPEEMLALDFANLLHPEDLATHHDSMAQLAEGAVPELVLEQRLLCKDGSDVWVALSVSPLSRAGTPTSRHMAVLQDISQRKLAEKALSEKERLLSQSQRIARIGSFSLDCPSTTVTWTEESYRLHGQSPDSFVPSADSLTELLHPDDRAPMYAWFGSILADSNPGPIDFRVMLRDGSTRYLRGQGETIPGEENGARHLIGTVQDITERKQAEDQHAILEAQLRQAQKMEAIGALAGGIAHDFNNLLTTMVCNIELARQDVEPRHPVVVSLDAIAAAVRRATELVRQILAFSRKQPLRRSVILLSPIIADAAQLLRASLPAAIAIDLELDKEAPPVLADPTQVHQVVMNLCTNAWQAITEDHGRIRVLLDAFDVVPNAATHSGTPPGHYARIRVRDTGDGMDGLTLERVFEPFFTTKALGRGSGLGLSVAHGIVKNHGGTISALSRKGEGATFEVLLPAVVAGTAAAKSEPERPALPRGRGRVLYVDDEQALAATVARILESLGYEATVCHNGSEAIERVRAHPQDFDVVLTDFSMPGLSGTDVARELARIRPGLPVVLTSGYAERAGENLSTLGICLRLDKPFDRRALGDALSHALEHTDMPALHDRARLSGAL